jgi:preprotein translocase subunit SecG
MNNIYVILIVAQVFISLAIIALVLLQKGKGAEAGAAFGSGASGTVFGARGSGSFLSRSTAVLATLFFANSLGLAYLATQRPVADSIVDRVEVVEPESQPDLATELPDIAAPGDTAESALDVAEELPELPDAPEAGEEVAEPADNGDNTGSGEGG